MRRLVGSCVVGVLGILTAGCTGDGQEVVTRDVAIPEQAAIEEYAKDENILTPVSMELLFAALPPLREPPPGYREGEHVPHSAECRDLELQDINEGKIGVYFGPPDADIESTTFMVVHTWVPGETSLDDAIHRVDSECFVPFLAGDEVLSTEWGESEGFLTARYEITHFRPFTVQYHYENDVLSTVSAHGPESSSVDAVASELLQTAVDRLEELRAGGFEPGETVGWPIDEW